MKYHLIFKIKYVKRNITDAGLIIDVKIVNSNWYFNYYNTIRKNIQ